jgi:hypothetical protein
VVEGRGYYAEPEERHYRREHWRHHRHEHDED